MPGRPPAPSLSLLKQLHTLAFPQTSRPSIQCLRHHSSTSLRHPRHQHRTLTTTRPHHDPVRTTSRNPYAPKSRDRGPKSTEDTQTDFAAMDIFNTSSTPQPATSIDACTSDGFHLNNGMKTDGGKGVLLVGGECFTWDIARRQQGSVSEGAVNENVMIDARGTLTIPESAFGVLELLHPKPDLLLLGTGGKLWMLSRKTRDYMSSVLGLRVDVMDTANASAAYNLLAQERGVEDGGGVGAALLPLGWTGKIQ